MSALPTMHKSLTLLEVDTPQLRLYNPTIFHHPYKNMEIFRDRVAPG